MQFYRLYAGADGQSHFEQLDGAKAAPLFNDTKPRQAIYFATTSRRISSTFTARQGAAGW